MTQKKVPNNQVKPQASLTFCSFGPTSLHLSCKKRLMKLISCIFLKTHYYVQQSGVVFRPLKQYISKFISNKISFLKSFNRFIFFMPIYNIFFLIFYSFGETHLQKKKKLQLFFQKQVLKIKDKYSNNVTKGHFQAFSRTVS